MKVPSVLELDPALAGQAVVNDKVDSRGIQRVMAFGGSQPAGACSLADLTIQESRCAPPGSGGACSGFLAVPSAGFIDMEQTC